jgi:transglutaminase-like putative cysteine protease
MTHPASRLLPPHWPGWRNLPREARDTMFLLVVIGWTVLPHLPHLPSWCAMLTGVVLLWRAWLALDNAALPRRWVLVSVLLLAAGLTLWSHRTLLGKEAGVTMLVVLMALKTLELRARRDAFVVFFLGFFLILTQFLYSQSLPVALAMLFAVWGLLTALVLAHMPVGQPALRHAARLSARCALLGAPVMALLFALFPRIGPLWGVPQDDLAKTGLSNSMQLGQFAELALDDSIALRIRFLDGAKPAADALYFRGPVLSRFNGREWLASASSAGPGRQPLAELRVSGPPLAYEMTVEPLRLPVLPLLEATSVAPRLEGYRVRQQADLQWRTERPVVERLRFTATAQLSFAYGPLEPEKSLEEDLELPPGANPRTLAWAAALRQGPRYASAPPQVLAAALMQRIRTGGYMYTLTPGSYAEDGGLDAVDEFWLDRRQGFCEHFAAAFVVAMRAMGVPARVVTGYQGADAATVDGYAIVRQSNAHAWAEYWQPGRGWVRADPTAAVAPERIVRSRRLQPAPGLVAGVLGEMSPALLERLRDGWEAVNNRWNQWVLNYSRGQQFDLLKDIGFESPSWEDLALLLIVALTTLSALGAGWAWWERQRQDPWVRQFTEVRWALQSIGVAAQPHEPPRALAERTRSHFGTQGDALAALLAQLEQQRYGRQALERPQAALTRALRREAQQLARQARRQSPA